MLGIGAKLNSTKIQRLQRPTEGVGGMYNSKITVARLKIRTYDAHDKRSIGIGSPCTLH